ncbi:hypothetical protein JCM3766R1_006225 [Sporobolomyces carnicolor]
MSLQESVVTLQRAHAAYEAFKSTNIKLEYRQGNGRGPHLVTVTVDQANIGQRKAAYERLKRLAALSDAEQNRSLKECVKSWHDFVHGHREVQHAIRLFWKSQDAMTKMFDVRLEQETSHVLPVLAQMCGTLLKLMDEYDPDLHTYENHKKVFEYFDKYFAVDPPSHPLGDSERARFDQMMALGMNPTMLGLMRSISEVGTSYVEKLHEENRTKRGLPNRPPTESEAKAIFLSYKGLFADSLHKVANNCGKLWMRDSNATSQSLAHRLSGAAGSQFLPVARY